MRRVVCAAMRLGDGTVICSPRHWDARAREMAKRYSDEEVGLAEQGFVDQHGIFLTREEAWKIAEAAGQILYRVGGDTARGGCLYSENLY